MTAPEIVNRVWNYVLALSDDGVGYIDYLEHLSFFVFLKMTDESETSDQKVFVPVKYNWPKLVKLDRDALELQYPRTLKELGKKARMLGTLFRKTQNKTQHPAKLKRLIEMTGKEAWSTLPVDIKGGANQYFTPRALIQARVKVIARDKTKLDILWLKEDSLEDAEYLPATEISATKIIEQLKAALHEFRLVKDLLAAN